ncbi:hypothetical protein F4804DRAFT_331868 [Jackrogersella minutella]|nr:hypothetical protein F4804DRAFT_331868 [Jackrogersella minutella]
MLPFIIFLLPLSALATPSPRGKVRDVSSLKPNVSSVWTPADVPQLPYTECYDIGHVEGDYTSNHASWDGCIELRDFAFNNNGSWYLGNSNNFYDENDWNLLTTGQDCALLVKNTIPTMIGNVDVSWFISTLLMKYADNYDDIAERARLTDCGKNMTVDFWLRSTTGLELS